jgi:acetyltransferase-like isoleucine patch superfamily enzyme
MTMLRLILGLLPASRLKNRLLSLTGRSWSVAPSARIHPVLLWHVGTLRVGEHAFVGLGNAFREMLVVDLGDRADIGQLNWFSGQAQYVQQADEELAGALILESQAAITSRHYFDCAGGVRIEEFAVIGGVRSTILTHYADVHTWGLRAAPIVLERGALTLTNCNVLSGTTVPANSVVAAGATTAKPLTEPGKLYGGVPAKVVADISHAREFADRTEMRLTSRADAQAMIELARRRHAGADV